MENDTKNNELDDTTQAFKAQAEEMQKKKCILFRIFSRESYADSGVYNFNRSVLIGAVVLVCFGLVLFFK